MAAYLRAMLFEATGIARRVFPVSGLCLGLAMAIRVVFAAPMHAGGFLSNITATATAFNDTLPTSSSSDGGSHLSLGDAVGIAIAAAVGVFIIANAIGGPFFSWMDLFRWLHRRIVPARFRRQAAGPQHIPMDAMPPAAGPVPPAAPPHLEDAGVGTETEPDTDTDTVVASTTASQIGQAGSSALDPDHEGFDVRNPVEETSPHRASQEVNGTGEHFHDVAEQPPRNIDVENSDDEDTDPLRDIGVPPRIAPGVVNGEANAPHQEIDLAEVRPNEIYTFINGITAIRREAELPGLVFPPNVVERILSEASLEGSTVGPALDDVNTTPQTPLVASEHSADDNSSLAANIENTSTGTSLDDMILDLETIHRRASESHLGTEMHVDGEDDLDDLEQIPLFKCATV